MRTIDPTRVLMIARADGPEVAPGSLDLGQRVRSLRKACGWTLEQAAVQTGLARSTLSKIENGQMSPTYEAWKKLVGGLGISVPQPFTPPAPGQVHGRMILTRDGAGQAHLTTTCEHELLAANLNHKKMLPCRAPSCPIYGRVRRLGAT